MKRDIYLISILFLAAAIFSCEQSKDKLQNAGAAASTDNPPMEGFDYDGSDLKAMQIADEMMQAMGGRENWDKTHYLVWNFWGNRMLYWNKFTGDVRVEFLNQDLIVLVNIHDLKGKVMKNQEEIINPDSLNHYLTLGKNAWINDSYWLVMPFKLKDTGVTLKYLREDTLPQGKAADVLQLTFQDVGKTPNNKYEIYVDQSDKLVKQWAYYREAEQDSANFIRPWDNYANYGKIMVSCDRSDSSGPRDLKVPETLPDHTFTSFEPVSVN